MYLGFVGPDWEEITGKIGYRRVYLGDTLWKISPPASPECLFTLVNTTLIKLPRAKENWGLVTAVLFTEPGLSEEYVPLDMPWIGMPAGAAGQFEPGALKLEAGINIDLNLLRAKQAGK